MKFRKNLGTHFSLRLAKMSLLCALFAANAFAHEEVCKFNFDGKEGEARAKKKSVVVTGPLGTETREITGRWTVFAHDGEGSSLSSYFLSTPEKEGLLSERDYARSADIDGVFTDGLQNPIILASYYEGERQIWQGWRRPLVGRFLVAQGRVFRCQD
jgi:hypothetical protein